MIVLDTSYDAGVMQLMMLFGVPYRAIIAQPKIFW